MSQKLNEFKKYLKEMNQYSRVSTLLSWDMYTLTPKAGFQGMADALTYFSTKQFLMSTSDELMELLEALSAPEEFDQLDETMQFTVSRMKRDMEKNRRIPADFFEAFSQEKSASQQAWEEAKRSSDFSVFAPHLEKLIAMTIQQCEYTDPGKEVYDVLLDQFEEGMDSATIDQLFEELKKGLLPLLNKILAAPQPDSSILAGHYPASEQKKVQALLLDYIGFSMDAGAVGESAHPFTSGFSRNDVRITNHYYENNPISAMFSAIHEGGHGIFAQNVNPAFEGTAADDCMYMGIHESQSRFFENILGRNKNFWLPIYDKVQALLPDLAQVSPDDFWREINHVQNSLIRTEADEVTYCFHIILRYEMEQAIFRDHVPVNELPALWNRKMQEYLQITPANDADGILQDMHWSDASFGYFPSYLLGNIYDGMFLEEVEKELGPVDQLLADGRIQEITKWLNRNIHWYGSTRLPKEVIEKVCGREASAQPLLNYFTKKYTAIYQLVMD
ncbi:MAG: carboxypeptidase M32 [Lachnospiraceae bacterium]|nr:carboxypeptidase M32 [Lachnospiraceae bacterium]